MSTLLSCIPSGFLSAVAGQDRPRAPGGPARMKDEMPLSAPPPGEREQLDARLVQRIATGDRAALAELYDRFSGPLLGAAARILRDQAEAQDVVHDAFVAMWEKAATFDTARGNAFAWAVTLVRNRAIDRVRMRKRRSELLGEAAPADLGYDEANADASASEAAVHGDEARAIRAAVATLPLEQKRAVELAFFGGLTQDQIARQLAQPLGTVKARIRRGLLKLRDTLAARP